MNHKHIWIALGLCAGLLSVGGLASCTPDTTSPAPADSQTQDTADTADTGSEPVAEVDCTITLQEPDGKVVSSVVLTLQQNGVDVATKMVGSDGVVRLTLPAGEYTLSLQDPAGAKLYPDVEVIRFTPEAANASVLVWRGTSDTYALTAPSKPATNESETTDPLFGSTAERIHFDAPLVGEGTTYIELCADNYTYVVFNPTRAGVFEFTASEGVKITYHGMPVLIYDEPRMSPDENGVISIPIEASSLGGDGISQLVFRIEASEGTSADTCLFTVTRAGDIVKSPEELATWTTYEADPNALQALETFQNPAEDDPWAALTAGTLTNLNLKDPALTVVLAEDGYYHLGTADGPMVFLLITKENPYIQSFVKMCETDHLRAYFYDENGTFLRKEGYNALFTAYGELANADGVVPLNEQLAYAIQNVGRQFGWWNYEQNSDIFGDEIFPVAVSWLFACAVYQ